MQAAEARIGPQDGEGPTVHGQGCDPVVHDFAPQWPQPAASWGEHLAGLALGLGPAPQPRAAAPAQQRILSGQAAAPGAVDKPVKEPGAVHEPGARQAWRLARELLATMQVSERDRADRWHVRMILKEGDLRGTEVRMDRLGHRLSVAFDTASMAACRLLEDRGGELRATLERGSGCFVEMSVRFAEGRASALEPSQGPSPRGDHEG